MPTSDLPNMLQQLHESLSHLHTLDATSKEALKELSADIERLLCSATSEDADEPATGESDSIPGRIQSYIENLEAQHPALTRTLSMIAERLSDMGI